MVQDIAVMSRFWSAVLGYRAEAGNDGCAKLYPPASAPPATTTTLS